VPEKFGLADAVVTIARAAIAVVIRKTFKPQPSFGVAGKMHEQGRLDQAGRSERPVGVSARQRHRRETAPTSSPA